mmetsp:Transcript_17617/g.36896  ORF Transcript_17617/g.36896 Transcript_17617/m.36896 type:complete len:203 (+) Transcript_17617:550-1158(+)
MHSKCCSCVPDSGARIATDGFVCTCATLSSDAIDSLNAPALSGSWGEMEVLRVPSIFEDTRVVPLYSLVSSSSMAPLTKSGGSERRGSCAKFSPDAAPGSAAATLSSAGLNICEAVLKGSAGPSPSREAAGAAAPPSSSSGMSDRCEALEINMEISLPRPGSSDKLLVRVSGACAVVEAPRGASIAVARIPPCASAAARDKK